VALERVRDDTETPAWSAKISFVGPRGQARAPRRIQLDITAFERVILEPEWRTVCHAYRDAVEAEALFYRLEEIFAEKLRTVLQRGYPRDVDDVWYLMKTAHDRCDAELVRSVFRQKCDYKGVVCGGVEHVLEILESKNTSVHWSRSLSMQIRDLPNFEGVRRDLQGGLNVFVG
jgi:predicted nucleotidyltransferase component of viral defense system